MDDFHGYDLRIFKNFPSIFHREHVGTLGMVPVINSINTTFPTVVLERLMA